VRPHDVIARFGRLAREEANEELTAHEQAGLARLELSLEVRRRAASATIGRARRRWGAFVAAGVAASAAAAFFLRPQTLTYEVTRGSVSEGGYIVPVSAGAAVRFSDRSELDLEEGTRLRVSHLESRGAQLMLEAGLLHVHINPRPHASWAIDAGPYVVHVTGTEFDLAWRVDEQTLDLSLHHGSVTVDGPSASGGIHMRAGQHLIAKAGSGSLSLVDESGALAEDGVHAGDPAAAATARDVVAARDMPRPSSSPAALAAAAAGARETAPSSPGLRSARPAAPPAPPSGASHGDGAAWAARVSRGDFAGVLESAERRGIDRTLAEAPLADLGALADAARYARRPDVARPALAAERARFPGSLPARDAAFFLGGLAEGDGDAAAALDWYETYLRESPDGAYAAQALGRTIALVQQLRGNDDARTRAGEYLRRFPGGAYAPVARKLLQMQ
jgi:hypothetical protein